jgi:hypothetical protein
MFSLGRFVAEKASGQHPGQHFAELGYPLVSSPPRSANWVDSRADPQTVAACCCQPARASMAHVHPHPKARPRPAGDLPRPLMTMSLSTPSSNGAARPVARTMANGFAASTGPQPRRRPGTAWRGRAGGVRGGMAGVFTQAQRGREAWRARTLLGVPRSSIRLDRPRGRFRGGPAWCRTGPHRVPKSPSMITWGFGKEDRTVAA